MDIVQFLLSVVNLLLALVVLFGGRFFMRQIHELQDEIDDLEERIDTLSGKQVVAKSQQWNT